MEEFAVGYSHLFSSGVQRNDRHSIEGYGSGFIHAYRLKGTERFDSVEVANEHVVVSAFFVCRAKVLLLQP